MIETRKEIERLYKLGIQSKNIATITDLTVHQVNRIIYKELGLQSKNRPMKRDEINTAKEMRRLGLKRKDIANELQCSLCRVKRLLEA